MAFNYQGVARDNDGNVYANRAISLEISLHRNFEDGPVDFQEEHFVTTNAFGLFALTIGEGIPVFGNMSNLDWGNNQFFIRTALDINGNRNFVDLGSNRLLSVPYAIHAMTAANATGGSDDDQLLALNGTLLSIEGGNSIDLAPIFSAGSDDQSLSLNGTVLSIEGGNSVDLAPLLNNSGGNFWMKAGTGLTYLDGPVEVNQLDLKHDGTYGLQLQTTSSDGGSLRLNAPHGGLIGLFNQYRGGGALAFYNGMGNLMLDLGIQSAQSSGLIKINNTSFQTVLEMQQTTTGAGFLETRGPNGNANVSLSNLADAPNNGFVSIKDDQGESQVRLYVNSDGDGVIAADVKNFVVSHPDDPDKEWVYASLEGPEAAAYLRGTGKLVAGRAQIAFPDHFQSIVNASTITVMLTPLSGSSKGMAVVDKSEQGFAVMELLDGKGNYQFDWEVKGIRRGYEDYQVERSKIRLDAPASPVSKSTDNSRKNGQ